MKPLCANVTFKKRDDPSVAEAFARARTIIAAGLLPIYLMRRDGQRVIQLWGEPSKIDPSHATASKRFTSQLLKTTHIVTENMQDMDYVLDRYRMRNAYTGSCLVWNGEGSLAKCVTDLSAADSTESFITVDASGTKKKVLIYSRLRDVAEYPELMTSFVNSIDLDQYDVTVALNRYPSQEQLTMLDAIPDGVRVIARGGTMTLVPDTYVSTQIELSDIRDGAAYDTWDASIGKELAACELNRLFGATTFDTFIYCGESNSLWYQIARFIPCSRKVQLVLAHYFNSTNFKTSKFALTFDQSRAASEDIFDALYADDMHAIEEAQLDPEKLELGTYDLSIGMGRTSGSYVYREDGVVDGRPAAFVGYEQNNLRLHGSLLPLPRAGVDTYLVYASMGTPQGLVDAVRKHADGDWECVVLGDYLPSVIEELYRDYPEHVCYAGTPECLKAVSTVTESYVKHFSAYVTDNCQSSDVMRRVADTVGVKVLLYDGENLSVAAKTKQMTKEEATSYVRQQIGMIVG
jgi:hypothetical protein